MARAKAKPRRLHISNAIAPELASRGAEPLGASPKASVFICHTHRCGSTLLCDALSSTGVAGHAEEYFPERTRDGTLFVSAGAALKDPDTWRFDWTSRPFEECLERVLGIGTSQNGVFAAKLKWRNMPYLGEMLGSLPEPGGRSVAEHLDSRFPNPRYVWVTRRDKVRQAVSLVKARQSSQWKATAAEPQRSDTTEYNFLLVDLALRQIVGEESQWEEYFRTTGITPYTVVYEDFVRNYEFTVRRLLAHLEIGLPSEYAFPSPRTHKQADAVSDEWVERYRRDVTRSRASRIVINLPALLAKQRLRDTYVLPRLRARTGRLWERLKNTRARLGLIAPQPSWRDTRPSPAGYALARADIQTRWEECGKRTHGGEDTTKRRRRPVELVFAAVLISIAIALMPVIAALATGSSPLIKGERRAQLSPGCGRFRADAPTLCASDAGRPIVRHF